MDPSDSPCAAEETAASYSARFQTLLSTLNASTASVEKASDLSALRDSLAELRSLTAGGAQWWVGYEMRRAQEEVRAAADALDAADRRLQPRKRFQFGKRARKAAVQPDEKTGADRNALKAEPDIATSPPTHPLSGSKCVEINRESLKGSSQALVYPRGSLEGKDVLLHDLCDARVVILDVVGAVRANNLKNCEVVASAVAGSVHVTGARGSKFWLACRQVRIHESVDTSFYLDAKGKPIVESCEGVRFGEGRIQSKGWRELLEMAGLKEENRWREVQDFNWLHESQSPHWSLVENGGVVEVSEDGNIKILE